MEFLLPSVGLLFWTVFSTLVLLLPAIALFSLVRSTFKDNTTKLVWVIVIIFVPVVGPMIYFIIGRKDRIKTAL